MDRIQAVNEKGQKQFFTKTCWDMLPPDKNGWTKIHESQQNIDNAVTAKTNDSKWADLAPAGQKIDNELDEAKKAEKDATDKAAKLAKQKANEEEFLKHIEGINKTSIKDFFDEETPPVAYNNSAKLPDLQKQLADHFKYDVIEFQKRFK